MTTKSAKLKATPERFRSAPARGLAEGASGVDRPKGVIRGYSVARLGVTIDDRFEFDDKTLDQIVEMGNSDQLVQVGNGHAGIKSRFTHPTMSNDGMGKFLGRSKNFRRDGDAVRADLHLAKSARKSPDGDLAGYVMKLAEEDPDAFGASIVCHADPEYRLNEDGTPKRDAEGERLPPLLRLKRLFASDVVDDPAVDQGFFGNAQNDPARFAADLLDKHFADAAPDVIRSRATAFLDRYLQGKGATMATETKPTETQNAAPELVAEREALAKDKAELAQQKARFAEEQEIRALCRTHKVAEKRVEEFLAAKLSLGAVKDSLLEELRQASAVPAGSGEDRDAAAKDPKAAWRKEYAARAEDLAEMDISEEDYLATCEIDARGGVVPMPRKR